MAMTQSPYGLRAVNELGGLPYAGSTRQFLIDPAGVATNIFNGSIVRINTDGYIQLVTNVGSAADQFPAGTIGVFVGCSFVNAQGQQVYQQYYPSGYAAPTNTSIVAYVVDDDRAVFQVQSTGQLTQTALGGNIALSAAQSTSTGSTLNGNSSSAVGTTTAATSGIAFRVIGFASPLTDTYTDVLVKFNPGAHSYTNATGVA